MALLKYIIITFTIGLSHVVFNIDLIIRLALNSHKLATYLDPLITKPFLHPAKTAYFLFKTPLYSYSQTNCLKL